MLFLYPQAHAPGSMLAVDSQLSGYVDTHVS